MANKGLKINFKELSEQDKSYSDRLVNIANELRNLNKEKAINLNELAELIGVSTEPCEDENDVMPLSKAIEIILNIDSSDRLRTEAEGVLVRFALRQSCEDCISREAAIKAVCNGNPFSDFERLEHLPSVKPKRIKGKWVYNETKHRYKCSLCTMENYENSNYCPYCGADMRSK